MKCGLNRECVTGALHVQSNLDYWKCQGPPDFLRIIGSSNFRNRYFSEMFGSIRSVLIFECISIKNGEQGIESVSEGFLTYSIISYR